MSTGLERTTGSVLPEHRTALVVGADRALRELLAAWLAPLGIVLLPPGKDVVADAVVTLVDVAFLRTHGADEVARARKHAPAAPVIALSAAMFAGVDSFGPLARALRVAAVVPKPVERERLVAVVGRVLSGLQ